MKYVGSVLKGGLMLGLTAVLAAPALAVPIDPFNTRQVPIGASAEPTLQSVLDTMGPGGTSFGVNAATDQSTAGMWGLAASPGSTIPTMVVEYSGNAATNRFGIWFGSDTSSLFHVDLFTGAAAGGTAAGLTINDATGTVEVFASASACLTTVNCGSFTDALVTSQAFGFYLFNGSERQYSVDQLNSGDPAMMLAYQQVLSGSLTTNWAFGFEDFKGGDNDYQDMVVKVESLRAVPEPASLLLLGNGLLGMGVLAWARRKFQA